MWGMQEADHYADAENTFMLINLRMNPWQDCLRGSAAEISEYCLFVCLRKLLNNKLVTIDCIRIYLRVWINRWYFGSIES